MSEESEHVKLRRVEGDLELLVARVDGLRDNLLSMSDSLVDVIGHVATVAEVVNDMRDKAMAPRVEGSTPVSSMDERRVWVIDIPEGDEHGVGPVAVMVEQFGDRAPTVAFRRQRQGVWGRPYSGTEAQ